MSDLDGNPEDNFCRDVDQISRQYDFQRFTMINKNRHLVGSESLYNNLVFKLATQHGSITKLIACNDIGTMFVLSHCIESIDLSLYNVQVGTSKAGFIFTICIRMQICTRGAAVFLAMCTVF